MPRPTRFSPEVRARAVRMVVEHEAAHESQWAAITSIAEKIGCTAETLRKWVRQAERDAGTRPGLTTEERPAAQAARAGELRAAARQRDSEEGLRVFRPGGARPPSEMMVRFIDAHRDVHGVEPICAVLPIAGGASGQRHDEQRVGLALDAMGRRLPQLCARRSTIVGV